jgi:hypothetical protein
MQANTSNTLTTPAPQKNVGGDKTYPTTNEIFNTSSICQLTLFDNAIAPQQARLLARLRRAPIDTITARRELDMMNPAARIYELKQQGYKIKTVWVTRPTECGKMHCVAEYVLQAGGGVR